MDNPQPLFNNQQLGSVPGIQAPHLDTEAVQLSFAPIDAASNDGMALAPRSSLRHLETSGRGIRGSPMKPGNRTREDVEVTTKTVKKCEENHLQKIMVQKMGFELDHSGVLSRGNCSAKPRIPERHVRFGQDAAEALWAQRTCHQACSISARCGAALRKFGHSSSRKYHCWHLLAPAQGKKTKAKPTRQWIIKCHS